MSSYKHTSDSSVMVSILLLLGITVASCGSDESEVEERETRALGDAYYEASLHPARFDNYVKQLSESESKLLIFCIDNVVSQIEMSYGESTEHCENIADSLARQQCLSTTASQVAGFLRAMQRVIEGENLWVDTVYGSAAIVALQVQPELYMNLQAPFVESLRPFLACD